MANLWRLWKILFIFKVMVSFFYGFGFLLVVDFHFKYLDFYPKKLIVGFMN